MDARSEYHIYEEFRRICKGKTGIIVTHRLGAARLADRILYVEKGKIMESGTHDKLMEQGGRYARMFQVQKGLYMDGLLKNNLKMNSGGERDEILYRFGL